MTENKKRFRIEFTVEVNGESNKSIEDMALQELTCMSPYPEDITFSEVGSNWHTGTPTENGLYLVCLIYCGDTYYLGMQFNDGVWDDSVYGFDWLKVDMLAWIPIEPYKED